jgi:hypothetical protein
MWKRKSATETPPGRKGRAKAIRASDADRQGDAERPSPRLLQGGGSPFRLLTS